MCDKCIHEKICRYKRGFSSIKSTIKNEYNSVFSVKCDSYKCDEEKCKEALAEFDKKHGIVLDK